jgi:molecular chaperone GrpE
MKKDKNIGKNTPQDDLVEEDVKARGEEKDSGEISQEENDNGEADQEINLEQELQSELEGVDKIKSELEEIKEKYLRLYSEFDNFRRRTAKERLELIKTANEDLMMVLLPIIDDFDRAQKSSEKKENAIVALEGYDLIYSKLIKMLGQKGLKNMEVAKGTEFNPEFHEAIAQIPAGEDLKGKVVDVTEQGYYLGDKVIRYAKVLIGA